MAPPDLDELDKLHDQLNRKLLTWEKSKLADLVRSFRQAEAEIKAALLNSAEAWEQMRLEGLLAEINRIMDQLDTVGVQWVKGRNDVPLENPQAGLAPYPALLGGQTGMASVAIAVGSFSAIHLPVLTYLQDYDLGLIRSVTNQVRDEVKSELKRALIAGDSIPEAAKRLRNTRLGKGIWPSIERRAEVIARTEILRASNQGALAVYKQYDVRRVKWLTAADERVCQVCGPLHGKLFPIGQLPFGGPPAHPRCRCFIAGNVDTTEEEGRIKDQEAKQNVREFKGRVAERKTRKEQKADERNNTVEKIRDDIRAGKFNFSVNTQKQNRHIEGAEEYLKYVSKLEKKGQLPSILTVDPQELVNKYAGTGRIVIRKGGPPKEIIQSDQVIGKYYDLKKKEFVASNSAVIVYSKTGTHIYPTISRSDNP